jgi:hypothetical protein
MPFSSTKLTEFGPGAGFGFHAPSCDRITTKEAEETEAETKTEIGTAEIPEWLL